ncbi:hypothetical protein HDV04_004385 [Boothiomyces sp. JEL0838]|nr:hypothetical protein HDV04_004385 [Boothiomyces sp. JEL0838]
MQGQPTYLDFHLIYTLPPLLLLWIVMKRWLTILDYSAIILLNTMAIVYTIGWDSKIIHMGVWEYSKNRVIGSLFKVPIEEIAFFSIQSTTVALFCTMVFFSQCYISPLSYVGKNHYGSKAVLISTVLLALASANKLYLQEERFTYISMMIFWASFPIAFLTWMGGTYILNHSLTKLLIAICLPTFYYALADSIAIKESIWIISETKTLGINTPWLDIPIEEFIFFLVTNVMLVFGYLGCRYCTAKAQVIQWQTEHASNKSIGRGESLVSYFRGTGIEKFAEWVRDVNPNLDFFLGVFVEDTKLNSEFLDQFKECHDILANGSHSFNLASILFPFPIRQEIQLLYTFCRLSDDLIDDPEAEQTQLKLRIKKLRDLIQTEGDWNYFKEILPKEKYTALRAFAFIKNRFQQKDLLDLLQAYEMDADQTEITTFRVLYQYCELVAGTIGKLCATVMLKYYDPIKDDDPVSAYQRASDLGIGFQCINIARDLLSDAGQLERAYIPSVIFGNPDSKDLVSLPQDLGSLASLYTNGKANLEKQGFYGYKCVPFAKTDFIANPLEYLDYADYLSLTLLDFSEVYICSGLLGIKKLHPRLRPAIRAATDIYMEIGRKLAKNSKLNGMDADKSHGRVVVPFQQKLFVALKAIFLNEE